MPNLSEDNRIAIESGQAIVGETLGVFLLLLLILALKIASQYGLILSLAKIKAALMPVNIFNNSYQTHATFCNALSSMLRN